jgi:hypothetical protein
MAGNARQNCAVESEADNNVEFHSPYGLDLTAFGALIAHHRNGVRADCAAGIFTFAPLVHIVADFVLSFCFMLQLKNRRKLYGLEKCVILYLICLFLFSSLCISIN